MPVRPILKMGEPLLLQEAELVPPELISTPTIQDIVQDLLDTMHAASGELT